MKLLIYEWNNYLQDNIYEICAERGVKYKRFAWKFPNKNQDEAFVRWFKNNITITGFDALLSVNYYPILSEVCHRAGLKYIAWCCDAPLNVERIEETLGYEENYVFLFDRMQFRQYANQGFQTVYHLPLGVNRTRMRRLVITDADRKRYTADVAFIGRLYQSMLRELMGPLNEYSKGYLRGLMDMQSQIYGCFLFEEGITDEFIADLNAQYKAKNSRTNLVLSKAALNFALASEVTRNDRLVLLNLCGKRYDTRFYSMEDCDALGESVRKCGPLDYMSEMPQMFACSKINLNPSLRIIQTGIPMRALDIMGAGGFLLANWQEELVEYFENEKEMVVYESYSDAIAKIDFYLSHETLRQKIAENGKRKTLEEHSMQQCMEGIFACAEI